jgi:hypothetical protein
MTSPTQSQKFPLSLPPLLALVGGMTIALLLTLINRYVGFILPIPAARTLAGHFVSVCYLTPLLFCLMTAALGAARLPRSLGFLLLIGLLITVPIGALLYLSEKSQLSLPTPLFLTANNLLLPTGVIFLGAAIGRKLLVHPNTLLAAAVLVIFFDLVMVTVGTVALAMQHDPSLISLVSVGAGSPKQAAMAGSRSVALLSAVTLGPADILMPALFFGSVAQFPKLKAEWQLSLPRTFWWMFVLLSAALVLVETTGIPIPAWVPMGIAILIANSRHAAFTKDEVRSSWIGAGFAILCALGIILMARRYFASQKPAINYGWMLYKDTRSKEIIVNIIEPGGIAEKSGLKIGDLIESVEKISTKQLTEEEVTHTEPPDRKRLHLRIRRAGEAMPLDKTLEIAVH